MSAPQINEEKVKQARDILVRHWPWAKHLPYNASPQDTVEALKLAMIDHYPDVKFKIRALRDKYNKAQIECRVEWVGYPNTPKPETLEKVVAPYSYWRFQQAEAELGKHGIHMDSIVLNALLKSIWGPRRVMTMMPKQPSPEKLHAWEVKQIRKKVQALKEIANNSNAVRPRAKRKPAM